MSLDERTLLTDLGALPGIVNGFLTVGRTAIGDISGLGGPQGDHDYYLIQTQPGVTYRIEARPATWSTVAPVENPYPYFELRTTDDALIAGAAFVAGRQVYQFTAGANASYYVDVQSTHPNFLGGYSVVLTSNAPDDVGGTAAAPLAPGARFDGTLEQVGDGDAFSMALVAGNAYFVALHSSTIADVVARIDTPLGQRLASAGSDAVPPATFVAPVTGLFTLEVSSTSMIRTGSYSILHQQRADPSLALTVGTPGDDAIGPVSDTGTEAWGWDGDDVIAGGPGTDHLDGGDGNDAMSGGPGDDVLRGGTGDDVLDADPARSAGDDLLVGGTGNDVYGVVGADQVVEHRGEGNDTVYVATDASLAGFAFIENIGAIAGAGPVQLRGDLLANTVEGNEAANRLFGEDGDDTLRGGPGDDTLSGGNGYDQFAYNPSGDGLDTILDFAVGDAITVDGASLSGSVRQGSGSGIGRNVVQAETVGDTTWVYVGTDDKAGADLRIALSGAPAVAQLVLSGSEIYLSPAAANAAPAASSVFIDAIEDLTLDGHLPQALDANADPITYSLSTAAAHGTVFVAANGEFTYRGAQDFHGEDSFRFAVADDQGARNEHTVWVTVASVHDEIQGSAEPDTLVDTSGDATISGLAGDDTITGGSGNDAISGGPGVDTARYSGARSSYSIARILDEFVVTDLAGGDGTDLLSTMERLQFSDKVFDLVNPPRARPPDYGQDIGFLFDAVYYLLANPELVPAVTTAGAPGHYFASGAAQGRAPNSWFDPDYYADEWADLKPLNLDDATLFMHYNLYGVWEGRSAGPAFDSFDGSRYLAENPDVAAYVDANIADFLGSRSNGAIAHFVIYGAGEQRLAYDTAGALIDMGYVV